MFCPNCGAMNDDGSRFCSSCGAPLNSMSTTDNPFEGNDVSAHGNNDRRESYQYDYTGQSSTPGTDSIGYDSAQNSYSGQSASSDSNPYGTPAGGYAGGNTYENQQNTYTGQQYSGNYQTNPGTNMVYSYGITPRSIAVAIILSLVTCGIYSIYWMYKINEEINQLADDPTATGGGMVILLSIITCGIYTVYWAYRMGEKNDQIKGVNGSSAILMLILSLIGLQLINLALLQDTINRAI